MLYSLAGVGIALCCLGGSFLWAERHSQRATGVDICTGLNSCFSCVSDKHCGFCASNSECMPGNTDGSLVDGPCHEGKNTRSSKWHFQRCPGANKVHGWLIFGSLFLYLICFAPGMNPMPWTINAEIYPTHIRSTAVGIATSVNWIFNLVIAFTFLSITRFFSTAGAFFLYGLCAFIGWIFFYLYLPETKGLPLEQIQKHFESSVTIPNRFMKRKYSSLEEEDEEHAVDDDVAENLTAQVEKHR